MTDRAALDLSNSDGHAIDAIAPSHWVEHQPLRIPVRTIPNGRTCEISIGMWFFGALPAQLDPTPTDLAQTRVQIAALLAHNGICYLAGTIAYAPPGGKAQRLLALSWFSYPNNTTGMHGSSLGTYGNGALIPLDADLDPGALRPTGGIALIIGSGQGVVLRTPRQLTPEQLQAHLDQSVWGAGEREPIPYVANVMHMLSEGVRVAFPPDLPRKRLNLSGGTQPLRQLLDRIAAQLDCTWEPTDEGVRLVPIAKPAATPAAEPPPIDF